MRKFRIYALLLCLTFMFGKAEAQINEEIIVHMIPGSTNSDLDDLATRWNSVVITPLLPGGLVGVIQPVSYPFTNPFNPLDQIVNANAARKKIIDEDLDGDGGAINRLINGGVTVNNQASCYSSYSLKGDLGTNSLRVGVFDSGVNYRDLNDLGYQFDPVVEVNGDATDNYGHGTHVASILHDTYSSSGGIGSSGNGSTVNYVFGNPLNNGAGGGTLSELVYTIESVLINSQGNPALNVINCSFSFLGLPTNGNQPLGGLGLSEQDEDPLYLVMSSADINTTLFVCAAGNDGIDLDDLNTDQINFPAAYDLENLISVASHDCDGKISSFSNYGNVSVDIAAPGKEIVSYDHTPALVAYSGTSQATAFVSGAAVILGSHLPVFDALQVKCAIMEGARNEPLLHGDVVANGMLDVDDALAELLECGSSTTTGGTSKRRSKELSGNVIVSPNPFSSEVLMSFSLKTITPVDIVVYNTTGQIVYTGTQAGHIGTNEISINFDNLANNNYYILRLETNEFTSNTKIIKTN